ncbi:uncharacterized protein [Physcomitrium patens]|uniref:uncharacterized protein isoform X1 n=2 Tax=Physcomitrium patens TaxID=3218 RepID=UPI000D170C12|nr:cilia- and flagella-associated protein 57-like isoform X1 [Physcomitrium patens]|eukprot:XP_024401084.1 cilia- and flagella-associated protein 57-like isoform X1 [Physcomitrella patens]
MIIWSVGRQATGEFQEVKVFATSTVEVCMSIDNRLFCASEDGTMIMFEMHIPGPQRTARANTNTLPWCSQVLISRVDLQDCINRAQELETKISDTERYNVYEIKYSNERHTREIRDLENLHHEVLEEVRSKHQKLVTDKTKVGLEAERKLDVLLAIRAKDLKDMEEEYCKKIIREVKRFEDEVRSKEEENARWIQHLETTSKTNEFAAQMLLEEYEAKIQETKVEVHHHEMSKGQITDDQEQARNMAEEDADHEIELQRERYEIRLKKADEVVRHFMGENGILKSKFIAFQKEVDESCSELQKLLGQKEELCAIANDCKSDIQQLQKDLQQRSNVLRKKDKRMYDLKRANQELETFKWVLDFKITDLVRSMGPSHVESAKLKERIQHMEDELLSSHEKAKIMDDRVASTKAKLHAAAAERKHLMYTNSRQTEQLKAFLADYHGLSQKIESIQGIKSGIAEIYQKHVAGKFQLERVEKPRLDDAFLQVATLEVRVKSLQNELKQVREEGFRNHTRMIKQNRNLVCQTRELREDIRSRTQTPTSSAPRSRVSSRPTTSDGNQLFSLRKHVAELQLRLTAESARAEFLEEQIGSKIGNTARLRYCIGVKKTPIGRR